MLCPIALRFSTRCLSLAVALAVLAGPSRAHAQPAPAAPPSELPALSPPKPIGSTEVLRPAGAQGEADVVLELTIDKHGAVTAVSVVAGEAPFSDAAKTAAKSWRFRPAFRGDVAVAVRIRFAVHFALPTPEPPAVAPAAPGAAEPGPSAPVPTEPAPGSAAAGEPAAPAKGAPVAADDEVLVLGDRPPTGAMTFTRAEVRQLPGAFGDPFRAIEALPGVTPMLSGVPFFYVRGAPPGNVGYFLDGIRVPLLYHIGLGPSVVHPGIVRSVNLYPGGYPARFGRYAGGIVAGETAAPRTDTAHGEASVRLVDAGALVEAPLAGGRGTALAAGRYSYTGLVISAFAPEAILRYWDYQARASYELTPDDTLSVFSFGAYDFLGEQRPGREVETFFNTEFHRVDLRWDQRHSARVSSRSALYVGLDKTEGEEGEFVRDRLAHLRHQVDYRKSAQEHYSFGADAALDHYDVHISGADDDDVASIFPGRTDWALGSFAQLEWRPTPKLTVTPGLRVDWYYSNASYALAVEPRVSARYELGAAWRMIHALGIAHQPPSFVVPLPGFQVSDLEAGLQRALQHSAGVEVDLPWDVTGSVTLFQNAFFNMTDVLSQRAKDNSGDEPDAAAFSERALGHSYGVEVYLRRKLTKALGGFISYTLSRSERSISRESFPSGFDRTHVANAALSLDLGRRWRAGNRVVFYSGYPLRDESAAIASGQARVPAFWRLDFRLEKRWRLGPTGSWAFVLEIANATLNKEVVDVECDSTDGSGVGGPQRCEPQAIGPVTIPSIGVEAFF